MYSFLLFIVIFQKFSYLIMAELDLRCCTRAFSSCSEWGFFCCGAWALRLHGVQYLWYMGLVAPRHVRS